MRRVLVAGGGTAGHVFPAIAVARELQRQAPDVEPVFVGVEDRLEARLVPEAGFRLHHVPAAAIPRRPSARFLGVPRVLRRGVRRCRQLLREEDAMGAVTFGGYAAFPLDRAVAIAGLPLVIHEQNSVPGLTNRVASRWAERVAVTFPGSTDRFRRPERCVVTGNPVREDLVGLDRAARREGAREHFGLDPATPTLLVFGGSQGARSVNRALLEAHHRLADLPLQVLHVAGRAGYEQASGDWARIAGEGERPRVRVVEFIENMADAYAAADVVVCRAGATSIAELTVLGLPSVLVPYPHATGDHQTANARALERAGGAVVVEDRDLDGSRLAEAVRPLLVDPVIAAATARASRAFGRPDAAENVARLVLERIAPGDRP